MPSIDSTPSRPTTPSTDYGQLGLRRGGVPSRRDTPTSLALASIGNVPVALTESVRLNVTSNGLPAACGASNGGTRSADYLQALEDWERRGGPDERRDLAAREIRSYLRAPHEGFLQLWGLGLREAPPLPNVTCVNLDKNQLTELPALPEGLQWLWCSNNPLTRFPDLPAGLMNLQLDHVRMDRLPALPDTLLSLSAIDCGLTMAPEAWPPALQYLYLDHNHLTRIPAVPQTLVTCALRNNLLTELPANFEAMQHPYATIFIDRNRLSTEVRQFVEDLADQAYRPRIELDEPPESGPMPDSDFDDDDVVIPSDRQLTDLVGDWYAPERREAVQDQWEAFADEPQAEGFTAFMVRLAESVQANRTELREAFRVTVTTWLDRLAQDAELRADTFRFADDAGTSCDDRAALSFLQMMRHGTVRDVMAGRYDEDPAAVLSMARSVMRQEALEGIAQQWVDAHPRHREDIEVYLAFLTQRSEELQLSLELTAMHYLNFSGVSPADLDKAVETVRALDDTFPQFLSNWAPWRSVLQRWDPARHESALAQLYDDLEQESDRTNGLLGPGAVEALHHTAFGPMTDDYLAEKGLSPFVSSA